jgi:hypothetical protein
MIGLANADEWGALKAGLKAVVAWGHKDVLNTVKRINRNLSASPCVD